MTQLRLPTLFGDYAVFPKGLPISVFGESTCAGEVTLVLTDGERRSAKFIPENGRFSVLLPAVDRYAEGATLTVTAGDETYVARNIAIGIVLLAGGQSNMEFMLRDAEHPYPLAPTAKMRFFTEKHAIDAELGELDKPMSDVWYMPDGEKEMEFSAIGYYVAEMLSGELDVTVGVVSCNQGASRIDAWLSPEALAKSGFPIPPATVPDKGRIFNLNHWLYYNKYLHIAAFTYTAVLWYQGESNTGFKECVYYGELLHELIAEWRENNPNKNMPFYLVELAPFDSVKAGWAPEPLGFWPPVREAISRAPLREKNVYTASITEVADVGEIHPVNKYPVAEKLTRAILTTLYGYSLEYAGPLLVSATRKGSTLTLHFDHADGLAFLDENGASAHARDAYFLDAKGGKTTAALCISGSCAFAEIPEGAVEFSLGYTHVPTHNLYNKEGYLASPFHLFLADL